MPVLLEPDPHLAHRHRDVPAWNDDGDDDSDIDDASNANNGGDDDDDDGNRGDDDDDREDDDGDGKEPVPWLTVATFWRSPDAHLARLRLESEGIDVMILDEFVVTNDWFLANAVRGIKLQVPASDAVVARSLLADAVGPAVALADGQPVSDGQHLCPRCGSDAIYPVRLSRRLVFVSILLLGLPLPMLLRRSRCAACGYEWR